VVRAHPTVPNRSNHLVKVWFGAVWSGVNTGVNRLLEPQNACPRHAVCESMDAFEWRSGVALA
jgi:hypothetical protein